jgi:diguanylate cyclase (GGDEF)-like protein
MPDAEPPLPEVAFKSERDVARRLTAAYVLGLTMVACLATVTHFLLNDVIVGQRDSATVINVAGRQRMLSQRIGLLASDLHAGDEGARAALSDAAALMRRSEDALTRGNDLGISHVLLPVERHYYFDGPDALDPAVRSFLDAVQRYLKPASPEEGEAAYRTLQVAAHTTLLPALDRAVSNFEGEANQRIEWLHTTQEIVLATLLITLALEAMFIFRPLVRKVRLYAEHLYEMATSDSLTGLANRRHFMANARREFLLARRSGQPLSVLILDIDHFKQINDKNGHAVGDSVLRRFAEVGSGALRASDLLSRIGGEEFALVLPGMEVSAALAVAEKLRLAVAEDRSEGLPPLTVSIGIGTLAPEDQGIDDVLRRADHALYAAKQGGRNRVVC